MTKRKRSRSKVLDAVHETARGMHAAGLITKRRMERYDALCLAPIPTYTPAKIKALRVRHHLSQPVFALVLNTSKSTVQKWEIGEKQPSGPSLKLLNILDRKGLEALV